MPSGLSVGGRWWKLVSVVQAVRLDAGDERKPLTWGFFRGAGGAVDGNRTRTISWEIRTKQAAMVPELAACLPGGNRPVPHLPVVNGTPNGTSVLGQRSLFVSDHQSVPLTASPACSMAVTTDSATCCC
jgi:hypothetical protein